MVTDAWQIEEDQTFQVKEESLFFFAETPQIWVLGSIDRRAAQVVVPIGSGFDLKRFVRDQRDRACCGLVVSRTSIKKVFIPVMSMARNNRPPLAGKG